MKRRLYLFLYLLTAAAFIGYGLLNIKVNQSLFPRTVSFPTASPLPPAAGTVKVERVVDGDTIIVADNKKVRYIGIDTPETVDPRRGFGCFGKEASVENKKLVEAKFVKMERDVSDTDKYGRLLRYVWVYDTQDATGSAIFVNEYLVKEGYARAATFPPDVKYADYFVKLQEQARQHAKGLWQNCQ